MTIDVESNSPSTDSDDKETGSSNGESHPDNGNPDSNNETSSDVGPPPSRGLRARNTMTSSLSLPRSTATANPLSSSSLKRLTKSSSKSKLTFLQPPQKVMPKSATPKRSRSSTGSKQAPTSSQRKPSGPTQPTVPTKFNLKTPPTRPNITSSNSSLSKARSLSSTPKPVPPNKTSVPLTTQPLPVNPPKLTQPETTTQPVEKSTHPENTVQGGPLDSADASDNPNFDNVVTPNDPSPSRVVEPEPDQNETPTESEKRPEGSPAKSPLGQSTQNPSDIESLYASPSPEKAVTELEPIELDSDPDFEMMELMLLSHRGPSSQSQPIKKESAAQSPALKGQRSHPSPNESSQAPPQTPQTDFKSAKRPRVNGPSPSDFVVLNERRKHPEFWDLDGTVILQVDDVLFRVMRSALSKASPWFQRLFSEELDHLEIMAGCPVYVVEEDFSHLDFANLLRGLENGL